MEFLVSVTSIFTTGPQELSTLSSYSHRCLKFKVFRPNYLMSAIVLKKECQETTYSSIIFRPYNQLVEVPLFSFYKQTPQDATRGKDTVVTGGVGKYTLHLDWPSF